MYFFFHTNRKELDRTRPVSGIMPSAYSKSTTARRFLS